MSNVKTPATRLPLLLIALLVWVLPAVGAPFASSPSGGGDSGVWILPRSTYITGQPTVVSSYQSGVLTGSAPRALRSLSNLNSPLAMQVSREVALPPIATLVDPASGLIHTVNVVGGIVQMPVRTLQAIVLSPSGVAVGVILDSNGRGYEVVMRVDALRESIDVEIR